VLIYLLIVVNFQSWLDPFVIVMALPTALAALSGCCSPPKPRFPFRRLTARDHVHGRCHRKQHSGHQLRVASAWRQGLMRSRRRLRPAAPDSGPY